MASPSTLNIGEPVIERSVDGNSKPYGEMSDGGDREQTLNERYDKKFTDMTYSRAYPTYVTSSSPEFADYENDYPDEEETDSFFPKFQITRRDIFFKVLPSIGAASYEYFSLKIMSPSWFIRAFSGVDHTVGNVLWLQSHIGIGLYVFSRRHFRAMPMFRGILYSIFGSFMFNYGSCLFWALGRKYLPRIPALHVAFGLISGGFLLYVGQDYLQYVDKTCSDVE